MGERVVTASQAQLAETELGKRSSLIRSLIVLEFILAGYLIVFLRDFLVPSRFSLDGWQIQRLAQAKPGAQGSYEFVASVYRALGLANNPLVASLLGYTLAVAAILLVAYKCRSIATGTQITAMLCMTTLFCAIYVGWFSKDVLTLAITFGVLLVPRKLIGEAILIALMYLYSDTTRAYWLITLALYVVVRLAFGWRMRLKFLLVTCVLMVVAVSLAITVVQGLPGNFYRTTVNEYRVGQLEASTQIAPFLTLPEPLGGVVNNVITLFTLVVPVPLVQNGGAYYLFLAAMILFMWFVFFRAISHSGNASELPVEFSRAVSVVIAFLATQAIFEPDYGSAIRHLAPLMPLMLYVVWQAQPRAREAAALRSAARKQQMTVPNRPLLRG